MSNVGNKFKIGVMVLSSFTLLILGLLALGIMSYFRVTYEFMTVVTSSVQGLEKGSKVKLRGVTIGQVKKIQIGEKGNQIFIYMEFDPKTFMESSYRKVDIEGKKGETYFEQQIKKGVKDGMRCKLKYGGITGNLYIDIGYYTEKQIEQFKSIDVELPENHPVYIPVIPTPSLSSILEKAEQAITKISDLDLNKISEKIETFLDTANNMIKEEEIRKVIAQIKDIAANLKAVTGNIKDAVTKERIAKVEKEMDDAFAKLNKTLADISKLSDNLNEEVKNAKIADTSKDARALMKKTEKSMDKVLSLREDLRRSIDQFNQTMRSARQLIDYLDKHPSSILKGKPNKPVVEP